MGAGGVYHVTEVIEFVTQHILQYPTFLTAPAVRMLWIDGAGRIEIAVGLLGGTYDIKHGVDVGLQLFVRIGLEDIACTFDGLIDIGIIERESHELRDIPLGRLQAGVSRMLQSIGRHLEILVAVLALTLRERQRNGHLAGGLDTVAPEGVGRDLH